MDAALFFTDTATENVFPLTQLASDLASNSVGRYNWITPDEYNDMHSNLVGKSFTYNGTTYAPSDAEQKVALGDNFLSIVVPEIEQSAAFLNNGMIVIWFDETEGGDDATYTMPEIVISPLAKGNAYASSVPMNHSSDLKTMEEIFGLAPPFLNNPIPTGETGIDGQYNTVASVNDLSDMLQPGAIPQWIKFSQSLEPSSTAVV